MGKWSGLEQSAKHRKPERCPVGCRMRPIGPGSTSRPMKSRALSKQPGSWGAMGTATPSLFDVSVKSVQIRFPWRRHIAPGQLRCRTWPGDRMPAGLL